MASIVFMGTPDFAVPSLKALIAHHEVIGVITQPDRPAGRGGMIQMPAVKQVALAHHIPVFQPEKLRAKDAQAFLSTWECELMIVAAYGQILPQSVLDMPRHGCINVHGSLLPRWRGAAPIHAAIRAGDSETGITIMQMDAGLDTGAMLSKRAIPLDAHSTTASVHDQLAQLGADLLIETLPAYLNGSITPQVQDESLVTYAPQIEKEEGRLDWSQSALSIDRLIRAFQPFPGTFTHFEGQVLKVHAGKAETGSLPVGQVGLINGRFAIGTGDGVYCPTELQLAGKKRLPIQDFVNGFPRFVGATLGDV